MILQQAQCRHGIGPYSITLSLEREDKADKERTGANMFGDKR